jgi:hypothetical protein
MERIVNHSAHKKSAALKSAEICSRARHAIAETAAVFPPSDAASALNLIFADQGKQISQNAEPEMLIAALTRALRNERRLARAGHWAYDINRHIALSQSLNMAKGKTAHRL